MLYILLSGVPPFFGDTDQEILDQVRLGEYTFDSFIKQIFNYSYYIVPEFEGVSAGPKDLIKKMLTRPKQRYTSQ